jgi:hypothetical protein
MPTKEKEIFLTKIRTPGLMLTTQVLYHLRQSASPFFVLGVFKIGF